MRRGRKPAGAELVAGLQGSRIAKNRLRQILRTMTGEATVGEASSKLRISPSRFYKLRQSVLADMLEKLEPRPAGRPRRQAEATIEVIANLRKQVDDLDVALRKMTALNELNTFLPLLAKTEERKR